MRTVTGVPRRVSVCFYFQVHQPYRLRRYSVFDTDPFYYDNEANRVICEKVANKCYRPATRLILDLVKRYEGRFRVAFSISGVALEQFEAWTPDVIEMFQELADSGACEFLGETAHHSLSSEVSAAKAGWQTLPILPTSQKPRRHYRSCGLSQVCRNV